jgi:hypothetical protein
MWRILEKTLGGAIAVLCLVSTLAVATEMTCTKDNGKGQCIAATDPEGKTLVVVGDGLKAGEQMQCEDRGNMIACQPLVLASVPLVPFAMLCAKDNGKGVCIAGTDAENQTVVVVGEGVQAGEQMRCVDRGNVIACQLL